MKVYIIIKSTMNGKEPVYKAFVDKRVAKFYCDDNSEEYVTFEFKEVESEPISNNRVIVDNNVYALDKDTTYENYVIQRIKKKLTKEELQVLGL